MKDLSFNFATTKLLFMFYSFLFLLLPFNISLAKQVQIEGFLSMDLEELMNVEVTSAFKKVQNMKDVPAAIYVITKDDIRRSGATSIPELLRMVPGVNVAKIDNGNWAISIRGLNGFFSDKLLVLMDGRTLYDPLFSGVFWDAQDTVLEDIDRIEVIRGPGASSWGTNAVNGVINIITKHSKDTKGGLLSILAGNQERFNGSARYGFDLGKAGTARLYLKHFNRHQQKTKDGDTAWDAWQMDRAGFRSDLKFGKSKLSLKGEIYSGEGAANYLGYTPDFRGREFLRPDILVSGGFIISDISHSFSDKAKLAFRFYYDKIDRKYSGISKESRDTFDFEFQNTLKPFKNLDFIWGGIYRHTSDNIPMEHGVRFGSFNPTKRKDDLFSLFFQNELRLFDDDLHLLAGVRLDHYNYSGLEVQPTFRLLYSITDQQNIWFAASRALRSPSRYTRDAIWILGAYGSGQSLLTPLTTFVGSDDFESEELWAYEVGYRWMPTCYASIDITGFANFYSHLFTLTASSPFFHHGFLILPMLPTNYGEGEIFGFELNLNLKPYKWWRLELSYSYLDTHFWIRSGKKTNTRLAFLSMDSPNHQVSFRSNINIFDNIEFDTWLRYVSNLQQIDVPSYVSLDVRMAWHVTPNLELSFVGKDLIDSHHQEFKDYFLSIADTEVPRSFYGKITWNF